MEYVGYNGVVSDTPPEHLTLTHTGLAGRAGGLTVNQPRQIPLSAISGVEFRDATRLVNGWVTLGVGGTPPAVLGVGTAASDRNTVMFRYKNRDQFRELHGWLVSVVERNAAMGIDPTWTEEPSASELAKDARAQKAADRKLAADEQRRAKTDAAATKRQEKADAGVADEAEYGREVANEFFGNRTVRIYDKGFVRVSWPLMGGSATYDRLVSIQFDADVGKKSGLGRGVAAVATGGLNLLGSNKRGDIYLTITTDRTTHVLHQDPPTALGMRAAKRLEAAGRAAMDARAVAPSQPQADGAAGAVSQPALADRMRELETLRSEGLITDEEYQQKRTKLLDSI